jgi:hypothetical protein
LGGVRHEQGAWMSMRKARLGKTNVPRKSIQLVLARLLWRIADQMNRLAVMMFVKATR